MEELAQIKNNQIVKVSEGSNPVLVFLSGLGSSTSRNTMVSCLSQIAVILGFEKEGGFENSYLVPWQSLRFEHVNMVRGLLVDRGLRPATINKTLSALKGVLKTCWKMGLISTDDYYKAVDVKGLSPDSIDVGKDLAITQIRDLIQCCEDNPKGIRDRAILALMFSCGLRRAEVVSLSVGDYDAASGKVIVLGKRNKKRTAYLTNGAKDLLDNWVNSFNPSNTDIPLFPRIAKGDKIISKKMTPQAIYFILEDMGKKVGLEFSPHDLRRTFISKLLDLGVDISTISKMAGHSSVSTTARYDKRQEQAKINAAEKISILLG